MRLLIMVSSVLGLRAEQRGFLFGGLGLTLQAQALGDGFPFGVRRVLGDGLGLVQTGLGELVRAALGGHTARLGLTLGVALRGLVLAGALLLGLRPGPSGFTLRRTPLLGRLDRGVPELACGFLALGLGDRLLRDGLLAVAGL